MSYQQYINHLKLLWGEKPHEDIKYAVQRGGGGGGGVFVPPGSRSMGMNQGRSSDAAVQDRGAGDPVGAGAWNWDKKK